MIEEIPIYPVVPPSLRDAASLKNLVPFIGAGASRIAGYPDWEELADSALQYFVDKKKLDHGQLSQVKHLPARVKLSLAVDLEQQHGTIEFGEILAPSERKVANGNELYQHISKLFRCSTTVVTTNYDEELDKPRPAETVTVRQKTDTHNIVEPEPIFRLPDLTVEALSIPNAVIHLHGSVQDRQSMVLTTADYLKRYHGHDLESGSFEENPYLTLLKTLFRNRNVIFIGYGLSELEILEYVLQKGIGQSQLPVNEEKEEPRHYLIQGFFKHELELARHLERYFLTFGIRLLPFSRNEHDWNSLIGVLAKFTDELPRGSRLKSTELAEMEDLLR